jgi:CheY-like chemotaxis protein
VDLLFTDVVMPGAMSGLELAQHVVRLCQGLRVLASALTGDVVSAEVLVTSGFPGSRGSIQRIADYPFPLLNKPYGHDDLARAVRSVLDAESKVSELLR